MKESWIKDVIMTLFPVLLTGTGYLIMTVLDLQEQVQTIQDQTQIARDQLKNDIKDELHDIDKRVAVLESK